MNPLLRASAFAVALLASLCTKAGATTVIPPTLDELVERSATVIRTRVTATRCEWRGEGDERRMVTVVSVEVDETIVGPAVSTMELEFLGGEIGGERWVVAGQPRFAPGHEDILFVSRERGAITPLVRMMYGRYLVARADDGRAIVARANGAPLTSLAETATPLGHVPEADAIRAEALPQPLGIVEFSAAIRESARRLGRTDIAAP